MKSPLMIAALLVGAFLADTAAAQPAPPPPPPNPPAWLQRPTENTCWTERRRVKVRTVHGQRMRWRNVTMCR